MATLSKPLNSIHLPVSQEIALTVNLLPLVHINYLSLKKVVLNTLAVALARRHVFGDIPLRPGEDPFDSTEQVPGIAGEDCQISVWGWPIRRPGLPEQHMTYGWLVDVLSGLEQYMVYEYHDHKVVFAVEHAEWGTIGSGHVAPI